MVQDYLLSLRVQEGTWSQEVQVASECGRSKHVDSSAQLPKGKSPARVRNTYVGLLTSGPVSSCVCGLEAAGFVAICYSHTRKLS